MGAMKISVSQIEAVANDALSAHGAGAFQAQTVARAVARAEQTGNIICGLYYLESYCTQLASGRVNGTVEPVVSAPLSGSVLVDAKFGFAQPAFARGLPDAVTAARQNGIAQLGIAHSHTCTSVGFFTEQIAAQGLVGIGMTNASAIVAGPGGKDRILGTNPIAFTIPGKDGAPALHADFSTAAVALGKITMAKAAGEKISPAWAVDADGKPTDDPAAALQGALRSAADYKGWALGLLVEAMAAGMTGSVNSLDVKGLKLRDGPPHDLGQFYILIDPNANNSDFSARFERMAKAIADDPDVRIPGAPRKLFDPVDVPDALWELVQGLATKSQGANI